MYPLHTPVTHNSGWLNVFSSKFPLCCMLSKVLAHRLFSWFHIVIHRVMWWWIRRYRSSADYNEQNSARHKISPPPLRRYPPPRRSLWSHKRGWSTGSVMRSGWMSGEGRGGYELRKVCLLHKHHTEGCTINHAIPKSVPIWFTSHGLAWITNTHARTHTPAHKHYHQVGQKMCQSRIVLEEDESSWRRRLDRAYREGNLRAINTAYIRTPLLSRDANKAKLYTKNVAPLKRGLRARYVLGQHRSKLLSRKFKQSGEIILWFTIDCYSANMKLK